MALFNRRKDQTITELESYYAGKNNQTLKAWVMAFLSLLVTVAVIASLFFGGRWIYRAVTDDADDANTSSNNTTETTEQANESNNGGGTLTISDADNSSDTSDAASSSDDFPEVVTDEAASTTVPSSSRGTTAGTSTSNDLPNTGAGEILLLAPAVALVVGYFISRKHQLDN